MTPLVGAAAILALILVAALLGVLLRGRGARVREFRDGARINPTELGAIGFGASGAVVQFSTEFCSRCPGVRRELTELVGAREGLEFIHVDVTEQPDLARKYRLLQTPTVLLVDAGGAPRTRLTGTLTRRTLSDAIDSFTSRPGGHR